MPGLSLRAYVPNLKSVTLAILELLAFNIQKFKIRHGYPRVSILVRTPKLYSLSPDGRTALEHNNEYLPTIYQQLFIGLVTLCYGLRSYRCQKDGRSTWYNAQAGAHTGAEHGKFVFSIWHIPVTFLKSSLDFVRNLRLYISSILKKPRFRS